MQIKSNHDRMFRKTLFLLFTVSALRAQYPLQMETRVGLIGATEQTPFFLHSNRYGLVPENGGVLYLNARVAKEYDTLRHNFDYGFTVEPHLNAGKASQFLLPQAYVKGKWKFLEVYGGRRKEIVGLTDTLLTSGSYIWSGNALPLWKIQAGIPEYTPLLKNGLIAVKGAMAHGWFDSGRPVTRQVKLHQKWIYMRLGKPAWKAKVHAGFNHQVQWGGESPFFSVDGKLPDGFANFQYVFFGTRNPDPNAPISEFDGENRVGNHLGTMDLGLEIKTEFGGILVYRQNIYEDGSLFFLNNITDGLNGLTLTFNGFPLLRRINLEYLGTMNQGGSMFVTGKNVPGQLRGRDNYFNHAQYRDGWTYKGRVIGTPLIRTLYYSWDDPEYQIDNNRVEMFQWALAGRLPLEIDYVLKGNYSTNLGTYQFPFKARTQSSFLLALQKNNTASSAVRVELAYDRGTLLPVSAGVNVSYIKSW